MSKLVIEKIKLILLAKMLPNIPLRNQLKTQTSKNSGRFFPKCPSVSPISNSFWCAPNVEL
jgi:hypothetical protein